MSPDVSVVVATYNRADLLQLAIPSILAQEGVALELIIVDDCSTDSTAEVLERARLADPRVRVLRAPQNGGPARARNLGWRQATSAWIAFTDDDCEPESSWLRGLLGHTDEADIVQGRTIPNPDHPNDAPWRRTVRVESFSHRYQTCNLLVRRAVLEQVDGFDETYPFAGEDADLGWRATASGSAAAFAADAVVRHAIRPLTFRQYLRTRVLWADLAHFFKQHPEARPLLLFAGVFHRRSHISAFGIVAVSLLAGLVRWWLGPVPYALYAASVARRMASHGRPPDVCLKVALSAPISNLWEAWNFLRASIRHRTLVL